MTPVARLGRSGAAPLRSDRGRPRFDPGGGNDHDKLAWLEPSGFLMRNYGRATPIVTLLSHIAYGAIVAGFTQRAAVGGTERTTHARARGVVFAPSLASAPAIGRARMG
jgi:hypothetical protein